MGTLVDTMNSVFAFVFSSAVNGVSRSLAFTLTLTRHSRSNRYPSPKNPAFLACLVANGNRKSSLESLKTFAFKKGFQGAYHD